MHVLMCACYVVNLQMYHSVSRSVKLTSSTAVGISALPLRLLHRRG